MDNVLAIITLDPKLKKVTNLSFTQKSFRFKCRRCAALCCKLGGPVLTQKDVKRMADAGHLVNDFLDFTILPFARQYMKTREDGSCAFLKFDAELNCYKCNIYECRPLLCRLYPFSFEPLDSNRFALKVIPCCRGLNNREGELLDKKFVSANILELLIEAVEQFNKGTVLF